MDSFLPDHQISLTIADITTGPREIVQANSPTMCDFICQDKS